jgi:hypothetical protein
MLPKERLQKCHELFILNSPVKTMKPDDINAEIEELSVQRNLLRDRLEAIENDYRNGLVADSDDQAIQLENAEVLEGIAKVTANELDKIEVKLAELKKSLT